MGGCLTRRLGVMPTASGYGSHRYWRIFTAQNAGSATTQVIELEFRGSVGGSDLTGSGTALSGGSGTDGVGPSSAFDNNTTTAWQRSSGTNTYLGYDFGSAVSVAEIALTAYSTGAEYDRGPQNFTLDWSDDGSSWTTADTFTAYGWVAGQQRTFPETTPVAGSHRFWRLLCVTTGGTQTQVVEMEMRATSGGADQTAVLSSNLGGTTGRPIRSGDAAGNEAYRAFDGVLTTSTGWFVASGSNQWVGYIFTSPIDIQEVTVLGSSSTARSPTSLKIQSSDDGTTWTDERSASGLTWTAGETKTFSVP